MFGWAVVARSWGRRIFSPSEMVGEGCGSMPKDRLVNARCWEAILVGEWVGFVCQRCVFVYMIHLKKKKINEWFVVVLCK